MATTVPTQPANGAIDQILAELAKRQQSSPAADAASVFGSFSSGQKANRVVEGNFQGDFDKMMLDRENRMNTLGLQSQADRNVNEGDALRKLQQTSYIGGGGTQYSPMSIMLNGQNRQLPSFLGVAPRGTTPEEQTGAKALQGQVMNRLQPGGSFQPEWNYQPKPVEEYSKPGLAEQISSYGATGAGILDILGKIPGVRDAISKIPGIGDFLAKFIGGQTTPTIPAIPAKPIVGLGLPEDITSQGVSTTIPQISLWGPGSANNPVPQYGGFHTPGFQFPTSRPRG